MPSRTFFPAEKPGNLLLMKREVPEDLKQ